MRWQCRPDEFTSQISSAIKKNKYLKQLRLEGCGLGDREAAVLADGLAVNTSITVLDLQKNRINNDGGTALAKGIASNKSLVEINLMNQVGRWGDGCLDAFLAMFDTNITLLKITWRLESRKSFALNKMITRNNEIDRRKKNGMDYQDLLPTALKGSAEGKENIPAHKPAAPPPAAPAAAPPAPSTESDVGTGSNDAFASSQQRPDSTASSASVSSATAPRSPSTGPRSGGGGWAPAHVKSASAGAVEGDPKPGVPKVRRAMPSVLSRWPPAQQQES
jgi:hypothetical protein